jgi:hypothetical protein
MKLKVVVPESLKEITLDQYQRFARLEGDNEFITKKALEIFCKVPIQELPNIRITDVSKVAGRINQMLSEKPGLTLKFKMNGVSYGFIPSIEDMTYGEFVDLDSWLTDTASLHQAMAVLYRPIIEEAGKRYKIAPYEATGDGEHMKQMPMDVASGALLFFWRLGNELLNAILTSLEGEGEITNTLLKHNLASDGDGIKQSIRSLKEMCEDLMRSHAYQYINV